MGYLRDGCRDIETKLKRGGVEAISEPISDRRSKRIIAQAFSPSGAREHQVNDVSRPYL